MSNTDLLFAQYRHGIYRYLCRITGQTDAAHDLTQDVFLRVTRAGVPDTDAGGHKAWLYRIARNLALNHLRDNTRRPSGVPMVDQPAVATQELSLALAQALASLNDLDRDVFLLRESGGLSYDEIAHTCDLSVTAVRSRLHRARLQLRDVLGSTLRPAMCPAPFSDTRNSDD
ncbi:MAG: RNA polymerase sigma factor [Acidobacteria bacterium]|nr:RNA polymerase sigma factor [Acidobacteriota bacterium]